MHTFSLLVSLHRKLSDGVAAAPGSREAAHGTPTQKHSGSLAQTRFYCTETNTKFSQFEDTLHETVDVVPRALRLLVMLYVA